MESNQKKGGGYADSGERTRRIKLAVMIFKTEGSYYGINIGKGTLTSMVPLSVKLWNSL